MAEALGPPTSVVNDADVAIDTVNTAAESAYESERQSYTTSLASSITNYKFLNGRRYHAYKEGSYIIPNDEKESDRLDIQHKMIEVAMGGKIFFSPIKDPKRILDIGTGTGIWAMEVGDIFPNADVLGIDLSPIQPRWVPPNVHFEIDDIEDPWTYANKFDFVFSRTMANAIKDWPGLVKQCFEFTRPGGYAEFVDYDLLYTSPDGSLKEENPLWIYNRMFLKLCDDTGLEARPGVFLEKWVKDVGFEDVKVWKLPLPVGTWASDKRLKEVGAWNHLQADEALEGYCQYLFQKEAGYTNEQISALCAQMRAQFNDPKVHCMFYIYVVSGRVPGEAKTDDVKE